MKNDQDISVVQDAKVIQAVTKVVKDFGGEATVNINMIGNVSVNNGPDSTKNGNGSGPDLLDKMTDIMDQIGENRLEEVKRLAVLVALRKHRNQNDVAKYLGILGSVSGLNIKKYLLQDSVKYNG